MFTLVPLHQLEWNQVSRTKGAIVGFLRAILLISLAMVLPTTADEADLPEYFVKAPPLSEDTFPCSDCHSDMDADPVRRELDMHEEIAESFVHARQQRWCLDCHNPDDRDWLRLADGSLVSFEESYRLCGQCHGTIYRDWKAGVHGKRTGYWNGRKEYRLCVHCHDPHNPKFKPILAEPPPRRPSELGRDLLIGKNHE